MRTTIVLLMAAAAAMAQPGVFDKSQLIQYTPDWKGERFADGRPKVPDGILKRMKNVTLEEAWAVLRNAGFTHQYEDGLGVDSSGEGPGGSGVDGHMDAGASRHSQGDRRTGQEGRPHRRAECLARGHAAAGRCLRLRSLRVEGRRPVDRRQRRQFHLRQERQRHRVRRRGAGHRRVERTRELHLVCAVVSSVAPLQHAGRPAQFDDDFDQRADAYRQGVRDAGRRPCWGEMAACCSSRRRWRSAW